MKYFFIRLGVFLTVLLLPLYVLQFAVDSGLRKSRSFFYAEWNDLFDGKINADLIILGSSRAWVQVSPFVLDTTLSVSAYNLGMDGSQFSQQYDRYLLYRKYNKMGKCVVWVFDFHSFTKAGGIVHHQQYLPYLSIPAIQGMLSQYNQPFGIVDYYGPLVKYNNEVPLIAEGLKCYCGNISKPVKYKGYRSQNSPWKVPKTAKLPDYKTDSATITAFQTFLKTAQTEGIQVFLVFAPYQHDVPERNKMRNAILTQLLIGEKQYGAHVLDYTTDTLCQNKTYFYNYSHLNRTGAKLFSVKLARDIRGLLGGLD